MRLRDIPLAVAGCVVLALSPCLAAASPGAAVVQMEVDTVGPSRPISRFVYGINQPLDNAYAHCTLTRFGGNRTTAYNWVNNASNAGNDYRFQNDGFLGGGLVPGGAVELLIKNALEHNAGIILTIPIVDYVSSDKLGNGDVRYVNGDHAHPDAGYLATRFRHNTPAKGSSFSLAPAGSDPSVYQDEFVNWVKTSFPGGFNSKTHPVWFMLDNEPDLWATTHAEIHPEKVTYAELVDRSVRYATAIKAVAPQALVLGPDNYGWDGYLTLQDAPDARKNGDFQSYYLRAMKAAGVQAGHRLLDVFDVHYYPEARGGGHRITDAAESPAVQAARLQATRSLWDSSYTEDSWITQYSTHGPIVLIPRLQRKIAENYPDTPLSISEYNFGGGSNITGALAEADALGIFGSTGVFAANQWPLGRDERFIAAAFQLYRNYDGQGATFEDQSSMATTSDPARSTIYASHDVAKRRWTLVVLNKDDAEMRAAIDLKGVTSPMTVRSFGLSAASAIPQAVTKGLEMQPGHLTIQLPPRTATLLELNIGEDSR